MWDLLNLAKGDGADCPHRFVTRVVDKPDSKEPTCPDSRRTVGDNVGCDRKTTHTDFHPDKGNVTDETEVFSGVTVNRRKQSGKERRG